MKQNEITIKQVWERMIRLDERAELIDKRAELMKGENLKTKKLFIIFTLIIFALELINIALHLSLMGGS
jgi:hypothetical protein